MSNELITKMASTGLAAFAGGTNAFEEYATDLGVASDSYLRFSGKTGVWDIKGQPVDPGSAFVFDIYKSLRGWQAWKSNKPIDHVWASIANRETLPTLEELPDHWMDLATKKSTDSWRMIIKVPVAEADGGPWMELSLPGEQAWRPINRLIKDYASKVKMYMDETGQPKLPIVEIDVEKKDGAQGVYYAPILTIVDWIAEDEMAEGPTTDEAPEPEPVKVAAKPAARAPRAAVGRRV